MSGYVGVTGGLDRRESKCDNVCRGRRPTMRMPRVRLRRDHPGPHPHCGATVARRFPVRRARYFGQRLDEDPSTGGQPLRRVRGARRATPNDSVPTTRDHRPVVQAGPGSPGWSVWATHAGTGCSRGVRLVDVPRLLTCPVRQVSRGSSESLGTGQRDLAGPAPGIRLSGIDGERHSPDSPTVSRRTQEDVVCGPSS